MEPLQGGWRTGSRGGHSPKQRGAQLSLSGFATPVEAAVAVDALAVVLEVGGAALELWWYLRWLKHLLPWFPVQHGGVVSSNSAANMRDLVFGLF